MKTVTLKQSRIQRLPKSLTQRWSVGLQAQVKNSAKHTKIKKVAEFGVTMVFFLSLFALLFI